MVYREEIANANGVGLYGKIPDKPDYIMANLTDSVALALSEWIDSGFQDLAAAGLSFPPFLVRFVFSAPTLPMVAAGVLAPSRDQVGRKFPLAIFHLLPVATAAESLSAIAISYTTFFEEVCALMREIPILNYAEVAERFRAIAPPAREQLVEARRYNEQVLKEEGAQEFAARLFGDLAQGKQNYAYYTFLIAALDAAKNPPNASPIVVECPVSVDVDLLAWLELVQRIVAWREQAPSFFWAAEPEPRLLIALGPAPKQILHYLADRAYRSTKLWPLTTDNADAIRDATARLSDIVGDEHHFPNRSIAELFNALQRR